MTEQLTLFDVITETASCWGGGVKRFFYRFEYHA